MSKQITQALEALKKIAAIELNTHGSDWEEIDEAQRIANEAIAALHSTPLESRTGRRSMNDIDWSKQHNGVHQAPIQALRELMPEVGTMIDATFPDNVDDFTWDVKVHMLMPRQYPCIPNWHVDSIPRENGVQRYDLAKPHLPMYLWLSNGPLTQFQHGYVLPRVWHRFTQLDQHRGTAASEFGWRGFIRATHKGIQEPRASGFLRRHTQVYLDAETFQW